MDQKPKLVMETEAILWNGQQQIMGTLTLGTGQLEFKAYGFLNSHLKLEIPIDTIETVETFLIYGITRRGVSIRTWEGQCDLFVVPELEKLLPQLKKLL